jgi:hypothetical protein
MTAVGKSVWAPGEGHGDDASVRNLRTACWFSEPVGTPPRLLVREDFGEQGEREDRADDRQPSRTVSPTRRTV